MNRFARITAALVAPAALLCACTELDANLKKSVTFRYDHVANAHQVKFGTPLDLSPTFYPINFVTPVESQGFWAIYVICSLDVAGSELPSFAYNASSFVAEHGAMTFGALPPYTVRLQSSADLNSPADTPKIAQKIAQELHIGPPTQVFPHGAYPSLNYRIAVFVPQWPAGYGGDQLALRYPAQPALMMGTGLAPVDLPVAGGGAAVLPSTCRTP